MSRAANHHRFEELRLEHPVFTYESYTVTIDENMIAIDFHFSMGSNHNFFPGLKIPKKGFFRPENLSVAALDVIAFNIGMIELVSYWKAACAPNVVIMPCRLNEAQIQWWKNVYYQGLGEFFYLNTISCSPHDFMKMTADSGKSLDRSIAALSDAVIVPVGGGKDSVVTLKLLSLAGLKVIPFILNPAAATLNTIEAAGYNRNDIVEMQRRIDPHLIELNSRGFLNGHTPFSAMLAFNCLLAASLCGCRNIALSNEASANESTIPGTTINHQYSKSYGFERDFRSYYKANINSSFNYFSFLRPLHELEIARIFSGFPEFFEVFRSCNAGSKTGIWCGNCPKCLFAAIILAPWLGRETIIKIFGKDILDDTNLKHHFDDLCGINPEKPFECVGTLEEVNVAMAMIVNQWNKPLPALAAYYASTDNFRLYENSEGKMITEFPNENNFLEPLFLNILLKATE
ncbi:MAG: hypothetical protein WCM76_07070 [Bacteroidota bacterium]